MPANKNAVVRYKILDKLLSDRHHYYTMADITEKVNDELEFLGYQQVTKRALEKDINFLEEAPFCAPIWRFKHEGRSCIRYNRRSYSIFYKELSDEEEALICEALNTVGQFSGLPHFSWLDNLQADFDIKKHRKVLMFPNNERLKNNSMLASLFDSITNNEVLELHYKKFGSKAEEAYEFHPYLLRQYNERWYLVGLRPDINAVCTLPLDRIEGFESLPAKKLIPYEGDITKFFDNVIGVTVYEDKDVESINIWVSDHELQYITTKPMHRTQTPIARDSEEGKRLASLFPETGESGSYINIRCIDNYELEREICSHFGEMAVLEPKHIRESIEKRVNEMYERYNSLHNEDIKP